MTHYHDINCNITINLFQRLGHILNLHFEKLPEDMFYSALDKTLSDLGLDLVDYTVCENVHYEMVTGRQAKL